MDCASRTPQRRYAEDLDQSPVPDWAHPSVWEIDVANVYMHERYHKRMISRNRTPPSTGHDILTCSGCDTANNDWESVARGPVDIYTIGTDTHLGKKIYFTTYYSLSAGKGNFFTRPLGDPTITSGPINSF